MLVGSILDQVQSVVRRGVRALGTAIARVTKPITQSPTAGTFTDLARSKPQLIAENMVLRQQLIVLNRSVKQPRFTQTDRALFVLLASRLQTWRDALLIVKPETVLRPSVLMYVRQIARQVSCMRARRDEQYDAPQVRAKRSGPRSHQSRDRTQRQTGRTQQHGETAHLGRV